MSLLAIVGLGAYLGAAVWCDARGHTLPRWSCLAALAGALVVAAGIGPVTPTEALAGAAVGGTLVGVAMAFGVAAPADVRVALVAGAWLGPLAVLHGTALAAATVLMAVFMHGATAGSRPTLATALAVVRPRRRTSTGLTPTPLPLAVPLAAGFAAAAVLAVNA